MKKFVAIVIAVLSLLILGGCATVSTLPSVDVSKMPNKTLTGAEIDAAVRGKQMMGNVTLASGHVVKSVVYVFEADGKIYGTNPNDWDKGNWRTDYSTNSICNTWTRWLSSCAVASVREGKLRLFNPVSGGTYQQ